MDTRVPVNQVPGGMISNLANQLKEQGALDTAWTTCSAKFRGCAKIWVTRPLVTPTSQIVGTQAVLNVLTGEPLQDRHQ